MKSCYIDECGSVEQIKVGSLPEPYCQDDEIIIETKAAALNHLDIWVRRGRPGVSMRFPHILGSDLAGVVKEIGSRAQTINPTVKTGDAVVVYSGIFCGYCSACKKGQHSQCDTYGLLGLTRHGTYSEYVSVPALNVFKIPQHLSFEEGAAFPLTYLTAWRMLFTRAQLSAGQTVLIHGIGGGVAQAALKLATIAGAEIIVTSSSKSKLDHARQAGANHTICYTDEDMQQRVLSITDNAGVDIIIDSIGAATMPVNLALSKKGGAIALCGITTGAEAMINLQQIYWKQLSILGSTMGTLNEMQQLLRAVEFHNIKPVIDSIYKMDQVVEATRRMEDGQQFGKIVLVP